MKENNSVSNSFYQDLKNGIIELKYYPGSVLTTQELSNEYGISRTPVREALVRLREENFLRESSGNKFVVSEITWKTIEDLYKLRVIMESASIRAAKGKITKDCIARLRKETEKIQTALDNRNYHEMFLADQNYHNEILSICDNMFMKDIYRNLSDHQRRIRFLTAGIESRLQNTVKEHNRITDCLEKGDIENATRYIEAHFDGTLADLKHLREINPMFNNAIK